MDGPEVTADNTLASLLRGETVPVEAHGIDTLIARARLHGVLPILNAGATARWPAQLLEECRSAALTSAAWELRHQVKIAETLECLHTAGLGALVLKGTALAYSLYADPSQRARGDTDLLFADGAREDVHRSLIDMGWNAELAAPSNQTTYTCTTKDGSRHVIDAHWRLNNSHLLSQTLTWEELWPASVPLPQLSPHARGLGTVHATLFASLHRCTHSANPYYVDDEAHHEPNRLIWLYDIALLARELTAREWDELVTIATKREMRRVCLDTFLAARSRTGALVPDKVIAALSAPAPAERVWHYLTAGRLRRHWMDTRAIPSMLGRAQYAQSLVFPGADYMQRKYAAGSPQWLPYLYARRAVGGLVKALKAR
jgi:hypothetical protein